MINKTLSTFFLLWMTTSLYASESIYSVLLQWTDENGSKIELSAYREHFVIITMTYTTCKSTCPLIMKKLKKIYNDITATSNIDFVIVTFDPTVDTPKVLSKFKKSHKVDMPNWHFLNGTGTTTRKLSTLLDIGYQKNPNTGHFMHDNKIILLDKEGRIILTLNGLDAAVEPLFKATQR